MGSDYNRGGWWVGARCIAGPTAIGNGKDKRMALLFSRLSFCRTAVLLWLSVSLAGHLLGHPPLVSAAAAFPLPSGATNAAVGQTEPLRLPTEPGEVPKLPEKRQRSILKANFEKMKRDADELVSLAKALQEELNKSNENILSLDMVDKADRIEKLAKKFKGDARSY
jgi:hypothetical protein